jgi:hypothetical protein
MALPTATSNQTERLMPRLLTRAQAAAYCGVSAPTFNARCPIRPVSLGPGKRLERFDLNALDRWIDALAAQDLKHEPDWLSRLDEA